MCRGPRTLSGDAAPVRGPRSCPVYLAGMPNRDPVIGDVVCLKSGGPSMTVLGPSPLAAGSVLCVWFHDGRVMRESFPAQVLEGPRTVAVLREPGPGR